MPTDRYLLEDNTSLLLQEDGSSKLLLEWVDVVATPSGVSSTTAAGSLGISIPIEGILGVSSALAAGTTGVGINLPTIPTGVESTASAGTATASGVGGSTNATATPSGASSTLSAGTIAVIASPVIVPTGVSSTATAGTISPIATTIVVPSGVSSTLAAGTAQGGSVQPVTTAPTGSAATSAAGLLSKAFTVAGIAGLLATASAGVITATGTNPGPTNATASVVGVSSTTAAGVFGHAFAVVGLLGVSSSAQAGIAAYGGAGLAAGQPPGRFATAQAGAIAVAITHIPLGVQSVTAAEPLLATLVIVEPDGNSADALANATITNVGTQAQGVSAAPQAGSILIFNTAVVVPSGAQANALVGNAAATTPSAGTTGAAGAQAVAIAGTIQPAWTGSSTLAGVNAAAQVGAIVVEAGAATSVTTIPPGASATAQAGVVGSGQIIVAITSVVAHPIAAGPLTVRIASAEVSGWLVIGSLELQPDMSATSLTVEPEMDGVLVLEVMP